LLFLDVVNYKGETGEKGAFLPERGDLRGAIIGLGSERETRGSVKNWEAHP